MTLPRSLTEAVEDQPARERHSPSSQCARILKRLQERGSVTNVELNRMGVFRYSARIKDLRDEGHIIVSNHVNGGLWEFVYQGHREDAA